MTDQVENQEQVEFTEVEQQAYDKGWRPKDEFNGPEEKWVPAETFMDRAPLFEKIDSLKKEFQTYRKQMENTVNGLVEHHRKFRETELADLEKRTQATIEALKIQKVAALENNEAAAVVQIDDQIADLKDELQTKKNQKVDEVAAPVADNSDFQSWVAENNWYLVDQELHDEADQFAIGYRVAHPNASFSEIAENVERRVRKLYPEKFENQNRKKAPAVEGSQNAAKPRVKTGALTVNDLSPEERQILNVYKQRIPGYTDEKYLAELNKVKRSK